MDTKIEIEVQLRSGGQAVGMAWLADNIKRHLQSMTGEESVIKAVGDVKIIQTVFTTKIK